MACYPFQLVIFDYLHLRDYDQTTTDIPTQVHMTYVTNGCGLSLGLASPLLLIAEAPRLALAQQRPAAPPRLPTVARLRSSRTASEGAV